MIGLPHIETPMKIWCEDCRKMWEDPSDDTILEHNPTHIIRFDIDIIGKNPPAHVYQYKS
jgi:hypothetical protein